MPIFIAEPREPLTALSFDVDNDAAPPDVENAFAESEGYYRLRHDIERYAHGELSGRSYLISGHRGSGKTTMVLRAIEDSGRVLRNYGPIKPLLVRLNGPDLLQRLSPATASSDGDSDSGAASKASATDGKNEDKEPLGDTQQVLIELTKAIYRAAADAFAQAYNRRCRDLPTIADSRRGELIELAAQLRIELDRTPSLATLREMWRRVGALDAGVLFPRMREYLGMRELIALSSSAQAYQIVCGKLDESEKETTSLIAKQSLALQTATEITNALNPLFGLLAGGFVGVGLGHESVNPFLAALVGTATGLAVTFSLSYSGSRSSENTRSRESNFLPDRTVASLSRTLPIMVERFREAGIALIFVVDELDKVDNLAVRMQNLVRNLKQFVTERAFFCFLTDREYMEELRSLFISEGYPKEHTYFSDRIFVLYRPTHLHKYLSDVIQLRSVVGYTAPDATEIIDHLVLPYVLLHRSRMHQFDLRRQMARMHDAQGLVPMKPGDIASLLSYRFDLLIQLAIEWLLDQQALRERLLQDEDFAQLTYDALYYPSRMWERGEPELNVSRAEFRAYLDKRMSPPAGAKPADAKPADAKPADTKPADTAPPPGSTGLALGEGRRLLSPLDEEFLYKCLRQLIGYIEAPGSLYTEIARDRPDFVDVKLLGAMPKDFKLLAGKSRDMFTWNYDIYRRSVNPLGVESILSEELNRDKVLIRFFEGPVMELGGNRIDLFRTATDLNILRNTPAWPQVADALRRLDRLASTRQPYADMEQDASHVWEYARMLRGSANSLVHAFVCASLLSRLRPDGNPAEKLVNALRSLSTALLLKNASEEDTLSRLSNATDSLTKQLSLQSVPLFREDDLEAWKNELETAMAQAAASAAVSPDNVRGYRDAAIAAWRGRFNSFLANHDTNFVSEVTAEDLLWAASDQAVPSLRLDLADMTISEWTSLLEFALGDVKHPQALPRSFALPALVALGFSGFASDCAIQAERWIDAYHIAERDAAREWGEFTAPHLNPGVLILVPVGASLVLHRLAFQPDTGMTIDWKPSVEYASLWHSIEQWQSFFSLLIALKPSEFDLNRDLHITTVLFEVRGDEESVMKALSSPPPVIFPVDITKFRLAYMTSRMSLPPLGTSPLPVQIISGAKSLDDAMEKLGLPPAAASTEHQPSSQTGSTSSAAPPLLR